MALLGDARISAVSLTITLLALVLLCEFGVKSVRGDECTKLSNGTCEQCSKPSSNCYWCDNNKRCGVFVAKKAKNQNNCQGSDVYYRQCFLSSNLLIIIIPCVVGGVLLILGCLIYCCCCRRCGGKKDKFQKEDKKLKKDRNERKQIYDHRKAERQARNEEIRMKYGLKPGQSGESRYQRLGGEINNP